MIFIISGHLDLDSLLYKTVFLQFIDAEFIKLATYTTQTGKTLYFFHQNKMLFRAMFVATSLIYSVKVHYGFH